MPDEIRNHLSKGRRRRPIPRGQLQRPVKEVYAIVSLLSWIIDVKNEFFGNVREAWKTTPLIWFPLSALEVFWCTVMRIIGTIIYSLLEIVPLLIYGVVASVCLGDALRVSFHWVMFFFVVFGILGCKITI